MASTIRIGIVGDFSQEFRPHQLVNEVLVNAAASIDTPIETSWLPTVSLQKDSSVAVLAKFDAVWCAPGSPYQSFRGALNGIRYARENDLPFLGTCGGFQHTVIEYARNVLGYENANSAEHDPTADVFITPLSCFLAGQRFQVSLMKNSFAYRIYRRAKITEHYYCTFGLNPAFQDEIEKGGLKVAGVDHTSEVRIVELPEHRFFIATLFVPHLFAETSEPHPLIVAFVKAAQACQREKRNAAASMLMKSAP